MKSQIMGVMLLGVALLAGPSRASVVTINFDDLPPIGPPAGSTVVSVTTQYLASDGVTFSTVAGSVIMVLSGTGYFTDSKPNIICSTGIGTIDCNQDITLTFANPITDLSFDAFGNDSTPNGGTFALADVYIGGVDTNPNIPLIVSQGGTDPLGMNADHQTLNFTGITKVVIHNNTDVLGTAYDNFSFDPPAPGVPEPSTLLLTGLCGVLWIGRRFVASKSS
jgi:hypothetical protein